jgi:hypothetical protein
MMNSNDPQHRRRTRSASLAEDAIEAAMRLASVEVVAAVHVVTNDRPTYPKLLELRQAALDRGLNLSVSRNDVALRRRRETPVTSGQGRARFLPDRSLRPNAPAAPPAEVIVRVRAAPRAVDERWAAPMRHWLDEHGREWRAGLAGLSEGTR